MKMKNYNSFLLHSKSTSLLSSLKQIVVNYSKIVVKTIFDVIYTFYSQKINRIKKPMLPSALTNSKNKNVCSKEQLKNNSFSLVIC